MGPMTLTEVAFRAADGYGLTLFRSPAPQEEHPRPVLVLPGANSNRMTFALTQDDSLVAELNRHGRDVWLLDFRGSHSSVWPHTSTAPVDLDRKLTLDLPAAIDTVLKQTGADRLDLVGHSLGGLFIYFYLGQGIDVPVGRAVTLCAPAHFRRFFGAISPVMAPPARWLAPVAKHLKGLGIDRLLKSPGPLAHMLTMARHFRPRLLSSDMRRRFFEWAVEDMPGGDLSQLMKWVGEGQLSSPQGTDYEGCFSRMTRPIMVVAAAADNIAPMQAVREAFQRIASPEKIFLELGKEHGSTVEYAHQDVLLAAEACADLFTPVARWLEPVTSD
jgi:pimeloyl-ACP methyl ester carboxylesterase